jgi:hypothetical protein
VFRECRCRTCARCEAIVVAVLQGFFCLACRSRACTCQCQNSHDHLLRAAGRQLLAANATAAAPTEPPANILFTVSATRATLTADALRLTNVAPVVQFYTSNSNAGVYRTGALAC